MLARTLSLTEAQKTQIQQYSAGIQPQLDAIHEQARTAEDALIKQLYASIRPLLTAEQQARLDALETLRRGPFPPPPSVGRDCAWPVSFVRWMGERS